MPQGFGVRSYKTLLTPSSSVVIRSVIFAKTEYGTSSIVAVIASTVLTAGDVGFFTNVEAVAGDMYFSNFNQFAEYPGLPGMFVIEGRAMFGADIVRDEAIVKLVDQVSA